MVSPYKWIPQTNWSLEDQLYSSITFLNASLRLYRYIIDSHWDDGAIVGPDPVGKIHWRVTRFARSYLPWLPGDDRFIYLQGQSYWIIANGILYDSTKDIQYLSNVEKTADNIVNCQPIDGAWRHPPIRGRKGFISTVEGAWASLGLLDGYRRLCKPAYLDSALKWYNVQLNQIGFQKVGEGLAINYYAHSKSLVPNVTTMFLRLIAELFHITEDEMYLDNADEMLHFIEYCQLDTGELPYADLKRTHFMCYQYNAFQFLDLARYYQLTEKEKCHQILDRLAGYLATGLSEEGHCCYSCFHDMPEVHYWTAALAAALYKASELELGNYLSLSEQAYRYLLTRQRSDGGFNFSEHNYGILTDRRSYPRYLAMLLCFLLYRAVVVNRQDES